MSQDDSQFSRRAFLFAVLSGGVGGAVGAYLDKGVSKIFEPWVSPGVTRRISAPSLLLPSSGHFDIVPAMNHPLLSVPEGRFTYTNEEAAIESISRIATEIPSVVNSPYVVSESSSLVLVGSSVSNLATRQILGDPFVPDLLTFRYIGLDFSVDLEYSIVQLHHEVTRVQDGRLLTIQNYAIINRERELVAVPSVGSDGMLSTDYVLITRVPRTVQRASATTYAALHGPGIRSIEKFLFELDKSDLDFIQSRIGDSECYQIILKVEDLRVVGNTTIPFNLTCDRRESCAPRGLRLKFV